MKKIIFLILIALLSISSYTYAQEEKLGDEAKTAAEAVESGWSHGGLIGFNLNQSAFKNWAPGGENSYSGTGILNLNLGYKDELSFWVNTFELKYGLSKQDNDERKKTDDKIELISQYGRSAFAGWYYSAYVSFKSQVAAGYVDVDEDGVEERVSDLFSPLYIVAALGLDKELATNFTLLLSPISEKTTYVMDDSLAAIGAYGVKDGKHYKYSIGAYLKAQYKLNIMTNTDYETKLTLFSDYLDTPENIDIEWNNLLTLKVNDYLNTNITFDLIYDEDVITEVQLKEILAVGISYKF